MRWHRLIPTVCNDVSVPVITSSASVSVNENATLAHALTANEAVSWLIAGGADAAQFELSGSTLRWSSNGTRDFEIPADANTDNAYVVIVRATDVVGNRTEQTITVTVQDIGEGTWVTTFSQALAVSSTGWNGFNLRQHLAATLLTQSGTKFRITFQGNHVAENGDVSSCHAGHAALAGDAFDFDGTQVQVTVGGLSSFTIPQNSEVVSDEIAYTFDETKAFMVAMHFNNAAADNIEGASGVTGATVYSKSAASETGTSNVTAYGTQITSVRAINKIEVFQP